MSNQAPQDPSQPIYIMPQQNPGPADDEIDLRELWDAIWQGKFTIIAITALFTLAAVIYALSQPNIYKSQALLAPASQSQSGGLSALAGQFGGLASLAGVNLKGGGSDPTAMALEVLKSRSFINQFINKHQLLVPLMASTGWNQNNQELIIDNRLYNPDTKQWLRKVTPPKKPKPSEQEAYKAFSEKLSVSQDKTSGLVTISFEFYSPIIAQQWVSLLISDINNYMRNQDLKEAETTILYLTEQLSQTAIADMQAIFYQLIEEQTKTIMLAKVRQDYVLKTIDPAIVPELKAKPKRALICVLGTILGGMLSVIIVLIRHFTNSNRHLAPST